MEKIITKYPKRRIIKLGTTSFAVVIPIDFVRDHHIKKDDVVEIFYDGEIERGLKIIFKNRNSKESNHQEVQE